MKKKTMKKMMKIISVALTLLMLAGLLAACASSNEKWVGVCMPKKDVERWRLDGSNIKMQLEAKGYKVELEYADDDPDKQVEQIMKMINRKCKALIIAAADCYNLDAPLEKASAAGIKIIAYDRLIMDTQYVDYYCTFDNYEIGEEQGKYIISALNLDNRTEPASMEIFSGAADDSTSIENYNGQMNALKPYIDNKKIVVPSGQTDPITTAIENWATENAKSRMEQLLDTYYGNGTKLDAVLSTNDSMAMGVIAALKDAGYPGGGKPLPVLTGMDCDVDNVIAIRDGEQSMSMFIDTRALATWAVSLVDDILSGKTPKNLNTDRYDNNVKIVSTSICKAIYVDKDNYLDILTKDGYYKPEDFE